MRLKHFLSVFLTLLTLSVGQMWGASTTGTFKKVTAADQISVSDHDTVIIVNSIESNALKSITTSGTKYGTLTSVSATNNVITLTSADVEMLELVTGYNSSGFSFKGTSNLSDNYLCYSGSSNTLQKTTTHNATSSWSISFSSNTATITNNNSNTRKIRFNSDRFACYTNSTGTLAQIYKKVYAVKYDKNGGTGTLTDSSSPYNRSSNVTVKTNTFTAPEGKVFDKWNTNANGTGVDYAEGATISLINKDITLYAQWKNAASCSSEITITKGTPSNGSFTMTPNGGAVCIDEGNASVTISEITPTSGYRFKEITSSGGGTINNNAKTVTNISASTTINVVFEQIPSHKAYFYNGTTLLNTGGTSFQEGTAVSYSGSTPESCDTGTGASTTFAGWADGTWDGKVAKNAIEPHFYESTLPVMGNGDVTYHAVFCKGGSLSYATSIAANDVVYLATSTESGASGVTGANANGKDATVSTTQADWMPFTVQTNSTGWKLQNGSNYIQAGVKNFSFTTNTPEVLTFAQDGSTGKYRMIFSDSYALGKNSSGDYWRFYLTSNSYNWYYVLKVSEGTNYMTTCCQPLGSINGSFNEATQATGVLKWKQLSDQVSSWAVTYREKNSGNAFASVTTSSTTTETIETVVYNKYTISGLAAGKTYEFKLTPTLKSGVCALSEDLIVEGATQAAFTISAQSNNNTYGTVSLNGSVITGAPAEHCQYASPAYTLSNGTATVVQNDNEFTVTPSTDCTVTINFEPKPTYTITLNAGNGSVTADGWAADAGVWKKTQSNGDAAITFPAAVPGCDSWEFKGWKLGEAVNGESSFTADKNADDELVPTGNVTYYAVYQQYVTGGNTYNKITSVDDLTSGNYMFIADGSYNDYVMKNVVTSNRMEEETISAGGASVSNTNTALVWSVIKLGTKVLIKNGNNYLGINNDNNICLTTSPHFFTYAYNTTDKRWEFTSDTKPTYQLIYGGSTAYFRAGTTQSYTIMLFKQGTSLSGNYFTTPSCSDLTVTGVANPVAGGSVLISANTAREGDKVYAYYEVNNAYTFNNWLVAGTGSAITDGYTTTKLTEVTIGSANTTITANFALLHSVELTGSGILEHGTISADPVSACVGQTITLSAEPSSHYSLGSWSVYKKNDQSTTVTVSNNTFTMPDYDVVVNATFNEDPYRTVKFYNNGAQIGEDQKVYVGEAPVAETAVYDDCLGESNMFYGWATEEWADAIASTAGKTIETGALPNVVAGEGDVKYYAVWATGTLSTTVFKRATSLSELTDGTEVIITTAWHNNSENNRLLKGDALTSETLISPDDNKLTITNDLRSSYVWTLGKSNSDYTLSQGSSKLGVATLGGAASLTNTNSTWQVDKYDHATDAQYQNCFVFYQDNTSDAAKDYFLEYNNGWTTYSTTTSSYTWVTLYVYIPTISAYSDFRTNCCTKYDISIADGITNGSISADLAKACEGATVTITFSPAGGYHLDSWSVNGDDQDVNDNTFAMPAEDVEVSATFEHDPCSNLSAPTLNGTVAVTYNSATINWNAAANASSYDVAVVRHSDSESIFSGNLNALTKALADLDPETQYDYSIMGVGDGTNYCTSGNGVLAGNFTTDALPTAHLTLIDPSGTHTSSGDYAILTPFNLPTEAADCSMTFMGWDPDEDCATAPTYAKGAELTFANTTGVTLHAVYATANQGAATEKLNENFSAITEGNSTSTSGSSTAWNINDNFSASSKVYKAGGAIRVGKPGSITTKALNLSGGAVTVSFKLKGWSADEYTVTVQVDEQTAQSATCTGYMSTGDFESKSLTFAAGTETSVVTFSTDNSTRVFLDEIVISVANVSYSNYSTECLVVPTATPSPAALNDVVVGGASGTITMAYENVNASGVTVGLFNDEACTEEFEDEWIEVDLDGSKNITYSIAANPTYTVRSAYIKLTAPETSDPTNKAVVVIPVSQVQNIFHGSITYEENGGSEVADVDDATALPSTLPTTTREHYSFDGWWTTSNFADGTEAVPGATLTENAILYAKWEPMPIWSYTYTSNVTLVGGGASYETNSYVSIAGETYPAKKVGSSDKTGTISITVPAGTNAVHFHGFAWSGKSVTVSVAASPAVTNLSKNSFTLAGNAAGSGSGTYTINSNPEDQYDSFTFDAVEVATTFTFSKSSGNDNRFIIYGVNAIYPQITLDPATYDFENVRANQTKQQVFTIIPNENVSGTLSASITEDATGKYSVSGIENNQVTVTFDPDGAESGTFTAKLRVAGSNAAVTADLSGTAIEAEAPEIVVDKNAVAFGQVDPGASVSETIAVELLHIEGAVSAAITGDDAAKFGLSVDELTANGDLVITSNTSAIGVFSATLRLTATDADVVEVPLSITVSNKWAVTYTSNVTVTAQENKNVKVGSDDTNYNAYKKGDGSGQVATIHLPMGTQKLHLHMVAWKGAAGNVTVSGDCFSSSKSIGVTANDDVSGTGNTYTFTEKLALSYYHEIAIDNEIGAGGVDVTVSYASKRIVLFGVNEEGGIHELPAGETSTSTLPAEINLLVENGKTLNVDAAKSLNNLTVEAGGEVVLSTNALTVVGTFTIKSEMASGKSGQMKGATSTNFATTGEAYIDITLGADGTNQQWHAFTVPFPVDVMNGVYDLAGNKLQNEVNYAIMEYLGDVRATGAYGWKKIRTTLVPGTFYIMATDGYRTTYRFKKKAGEALVASATKNLEEYPSTTGNNDNGWNGVGNPTLVYGKVNYPVQVLDPGSYTYVTKTANNTNFVVGTPFFIQADATAAENNMTMLAVDAEKPYYAPARVQTTEIKDLPVAFGNEDFTDYLYVSANEDALNQYETGKDLAKMTMTNTPKVAQIFGKAYNTKLCMVHTPLVNNQAEVALELYAPNTGEYTISAPAIEGYEVYLTREGAIIWNLSMSPYEAELLKGTTNEYGLKIVAAPQVITDIEQSTISDQPSVQKVIIDDKVFILRGEQLFDVTGKTIR